MGNADGKLVIRLANAIFGISPQTGLLNLLFEIIDGELVAETVEGDAGVDFSDDERIRLVLGVVVFGNVSAKLLQALGEIEDPDAAKERFSELVEGMSGEAFVEEEIGRAVNAHPELLVAAAFTFEQAQDGKTAYRLYRNPDVGRGQAIGYLQHVHREFQAKKAAARSQDPGTNGSN